MSHPYHHAESSARKFGGTPENYLAIHSWFDQSKQLLANFRHRAMRHHAWGIFAAERIFGTVITNSDGKQVPVRFIGEQHVREDCGGIIPSFADWVRKIPAQRWMSVGDLRDDTIGVQNDDLSLEAWRQAVAEGRTTLGHSDWIERHYLAGDGSLPLS